ncbi:sigma-70 family RNA polymerase sigma factor [Pseudomonas sp. HK3]
MAACDENSMNLFVSENHGWLVRFLTGRLGSAQDAQDISQDTFLRIISASVVLPDVRESKAYLATIANRLIIDKARRKKLEHAYLQLHMHSDDVAPSAEEIHVNIERLEQVASLLEGLADKPRKAFLMARIDGLAYKDIAQELGVSVSMVKKYIAQSLLHCLTHLDLD